MAQVWEWWDNRRWVAYDEATSMLLEAAMRAGGAVVRPTHGFYAANPCYEINVVTLLQVS